MTRVVIDGGNVHALEAAHVADWRWNGWVVPYFTREEGSKLIEQTAKLRAEYGPEAAQLVAWDEERQLFTLTADYSAPEGEETEDIAGVEIDGQLLYGIGAASWTWELAE